MSVLPNFETQAGTENFGSLYDKSWHVSVCAKHASLMYGLGIVNAVLKPDTIGTHTISLRTLQRCVGIESGWPGTTLTCGI